MPVQLGLEIPSRKERFYCLCSPDLLASVFCFLPRVAATHAMRLSLPQDEATNSCTLFDKTSVRSRHFARQALLFARNASCCPSSTAYPKTIRVLAGRVSSSLAGVPLEL